MLILILIMRLLDYEHQLLCFNSVSSLTDLVCVIFSYMLYCIANSILYSTEFLLRLKENAT